MPESKRRKIAANNGLFRLLDPPLVSDAIIKEVRQNPLSAAIKYEFGLPYGNKTHCYPLHQAIRLRANIDIVEAIFSSFPQAIKETSQGITALHLSIIDRAPVEVFLFLISKWPEAVRRTDEVTGDTMLHIASFNQAPNEVFSSLLHVIPNAAKQKSRYSKQTPLHAVFNGKKTVPFETISLLLDHHPGALQEKDNVGRTPLHCAASHGGAILNVILLLVENFPYAISEKDIHGMIPLELHRGSKQFDQQICQLLSSASQLYSGNEIERDELEVMIDFFIQIGWKNGVLLLLDRHPALMKKIDIHYKVFPALISSIAQQCKMKTMWEIVGNELDIMESV